MVEPLPSSMADRNKLRSRISSKRSRKRLTYRRNADRQSDRQWWYRPRKRVQRASKLDAYKPQIVRWLEQYQYTGVQILQRLREAGYEGGRSILQEYVDDPAAEVQGLPHAVVLEAFRQRFAPQGHGDAESAGQFPAIHHGVRRTACWSRVHVGRYRYDGHFWWKDLASEAIPRGLTGADHVIGSSSLSQRCPPVRLGEDGVQS